MGQGSEQLEVKELFTKFSVYALDCFTFGMSLTTGILFVNSIIVALLVCFAIIGYTLMKLL